MIRVNLSGDNMEKWRINGLAHDFMQEIKRIPGDYKRAFADAEKPEEKTGQDSANGKRWYEALPSEIVNDQYLRQKRDRIRFVLSLFDDMDSKGLMPEGDGPFRKKEIRKARRDFIRLIPKEDRREGKKESDFITRTRQMMIIVIKKENPFELRKKLQEVEARLEKLTAWGLEGLSI